MRTLIVLITVSIVNFTFAQAQEIEKELKMNNNVSNGFEGITNEMNAGEVSVQEMDQDSMAIEHKEIEIDKKDKLERNRDKRKEQVKDVRSAKKLDLPKPASPVPAAVLEDESQFNSEIAPETAGYGAGPEVVVTPTSISGGASTEVYMTNSSSFNITNERANTQRMQRSPSIEQQSQMDAAVDYFQTNAPESFEFNYFKYTAGNYDVSLYRNLEVAEAVRPNNSDVHVQMAGYFMIKDQKDSALVYLDKLIESERLADNVIEYAGDVLRSVPEKGMLITHGFDDSYGVYYVQQQKNIRPDVTLLSLDFMQSDYYRAALVEEGYELPESEVIDVDYLNKFCALNADKNLSISLTTPKEYFKPMAGKLFVVGLVFEYHTDKYDNFYKNDYLWNEEFTKAVIFHPVDEKGKQLSANYLPMLLHLRKVYNQRGEDDKRDEVDEVSDKVGVQSKKYEQVQKVKASY